MSDAHKKAQSAGPPAEDADGVKGSSDSADDREAVGYGRPPRHSRYKPGESGNRRGRPRGAKSAEATLESLFKQKVTIQDAGGRRKVSAMEALMRALMQRALRGDNRAAKLLLDVQQRLPAPDAPLSDAPASAEDQAILAAFLAKRRDAGESVGAAVEAYGTVDGGAMDPFEPSASGVDESAK